VREHQNIKNK